MEHAHHMAIPMFARVHQVSQELTVSVSIPASLWRTHKTFFTIDFMGRQVFKMFSSYQLDKFLQIIAVWSYIYAILDSLKKILLPNYEHLFTQQRRVSQKLIQYVLI